MAKKQNINLSVVSKNEMQEVLATSRRGRGGRTSRWEPVRETLADLGDDNAIKLNLHKREVQGLRQYISKHMPGEVKVVSSRVRGEDDQYHVFVTKAAGKGGKKR